jgi:hypothetical protein
MPYRNRDGKLFCTKACLKGGEVPDAFASLSDAVSAKSRLIETSGGGVAVEVSRLRSRAV